MYLRIAIIGLSCSIFAAGGCGSSDERPADSNGDASTRTDEQGVSREGPGKSDASIATGESCGEGKCKEPATCKDGKRCACPEGYEDPKGDGSECKDIDECANRSAKCKKGAGCTNKPGSYKCECEAPAYTGDDDHCDCAEGYERNDQGLCLAVDGHACTDSLDCLHGACEGETCCAQDCGQPPACHIAKGATCSDGKTCEYPVAPDGDDCDDGQACTGNGACKAGKCTPSTKRTDCNDNNPCTDDSCEEPTGCKNQNNTASCDDGSACTSSDHCLGGSCQGTARDCTGNSDVCNLGDCDPKSGECTKKPRSDGTHCDDANSCTLTDTCQGGSCHGDGNACGSNATECKEGKPNDCTCAKDFENSDGHCVPTNNECGRMTMCSPNATCLDPSNADGDAKCTCKPGFTGDGMTCTMADPCSPNPCGNGTCKADDAGGHTCTCPAGSRATGGTCGCDLSGVFGMRMRSEVSWHDLDQIEDGNAVTYTYVIQHHSYDGNGRLTMELGDCGGTTFDFCDVPLPPLLGSEAYAQYVPSEVWDAPTEPRFNVPVDLPSSAPGGAFTTPNFAMFSGMTLADPLGEFPKTRKDVTGTPAFDGSAVNGATWLDHDNDTNVGVTTFIVPPGGIKRDGMFPDPQQDYGPDSMDCPRNKGGARYPYAYLPALAGGINTIRISRVYAGVRTIFAYKGSIVSCDEISGDVTGPASGKLQADGRVGGCIRNNGGESACPDSAIDFLDKQPQTQDVHATTFKLVRLPANAKCSDVRAAKYD